MSGVDVGVEDAVMVFDEEMEDKNCMIAHLCVWNLVLETFSSLDFSKLSFTTTSSLDDSSTAFRSAVVDFIEHSLVLTGTMPVADVGNPGAPQNNFHIELIGTRRSSCTLSNLCVSHFQLLRACESDY